MGSSLPGAIWLDVHIREVDEPQHSVDLFEFRGAADCVEEEADIDASLGPPASRVKEKRAWPPDAPVQISP